MSMSAGSTAETQVWQRDSELPQVAKWPAPWRLRGSAYVLALRMPEPLLETQAFVPPSLAGKRTGNLAYVLFVDYESADCGPYRELMFAPGGFEFAGSHSSHARAPSITRIFVSSFESVVNGRANWGIPKDRADFTRERAADGSEELRVLRDGHEFFFMRVRPRGPSLPVHSALIPAALKTVKQHWLGKQYSITLQASGKLGMAKLLECRSDPSCFPDLTQGRVLIAAYLPSFEMTFPVADVQPLERE